VEIEHGYEEPLAGGTDVMRKLQNQLLEEQGRPPRPEASRLAASKPRTLALRSPFYEASDKVYGLMSAVQAEPMLREDKKLQQFAKGLKKLISDLHDHLDSTYIWD